MSGSKLEIELRIHAIDQMLDRTDPWEDPPYRYQRLKLRRERGRLEAVRGGRHPSNFVGDTQTPYKRLNAKEKDLWGLKREILGMLEVLDRKKGR